MGVILSYFGIQYQALLFFERRLIVVWVRWRQVHTCFLIFHRLIKLKIRSLPWLPQLDCCLRVAILNVGWCKVLLLLLLWTDIKQWRCFKCNLLQILLVAIGIVLRREIYHLRRCRELLQWLQRLLFIMLFHVYIVSATKQTLLPRLRQTYRLRVGALIK